MDLGPEPVDIVDGVIALCLFAVLVGRAAHIDNVDQSLCMTQIIEELVAQTLSFRGTGYQTGDIHDLNRHVPYTIHATS